MKTSAQSVLSLTDFNAKLLPDDVTKSSFEKLMADNGYVRMCNIPEEFDHVAFCDGLGSFVPQYGGIMVGDVRPEPGMDDVYHSGNTKPLLPHTEGYDFETLPPRYIALWCVQPCQGAGGETTIADAYAWLDHLENPVRDELHRRIYPWKTTDGVLRMGLDLRTEHPVLESHAAGLIFRFSCNNILPESDDDFIRPLLEDGRSYFESHHVAIDYDRNDMLIWDNWRMWHARNGFVDRGRHLKRIQVAA